MAVVAALLGLGSGATAARAGAAADAALAAGASGFADVAAASRTSTSVPSETLSPTLTFTSFTVPATGAGTSMVALSDSRVRMESSAFTLSPGFTITSITGTSWKPPISGILTSIVWDIVLVSSGQGPRKNPLLPPRRKGRKDFSFPDFPRALRVFAAGIILKPSADSASRDRFRTSGWRRRSGHGQS